jgi:hypothetical protein
MKISDKIKSLFQRRPPTEEELAARAEAKRELEQTRTEVGTHRNPTEVPPV